MLGRLVPTLLGMCLGLACGDSAFRCEDDTQCARDGLQGQCQANQFCTFPDDSCPSGQRYGSDAGSGLADMCLNVDEAGTDAATSVGEGTTSGMPATTAATTTASTSTGSADGTDDTTTTSPPADVPPMPDPYGDCFDIDDCQFVTGECVELDTTAVCAPPCETVRECPQPVDPSAATDCILDGTGKGWCTLTCATTNDCPAGMECDPDAIDLFGVPICAWD